MMPFSTLIGAIFCPFLSLFSQQLMKIREISFVDQLCFQLLSNEVWSNYCKCLFILNFCLTGLRFWSRTFIDFEFFIFLNDLSCSHSFLESTISVAQNQRHSSLFVKKLDGHLGCFLVRNPVGLAFLTPPQNTKLRPLEIERLVGLCLNFTVLFTTKLWKMKHLLIQFWFSPRAWFEKLLPKIDASSCSWNLAMQQQ